MPIIDKLESKFGRYAFHGIIQVIAVLQLGVLALLVLLPRESAMNYVSWLQFDREAVLHGQVWRLVTHALVLDLFFAMQTVVGMLFWGFFGAQVMMFFGRGIEQAWGAFRTCLYIAGWFFCSAVSGLLLGVTPSGVLLAQTILFAFAVMYPNEELLLFFILPVKIKWIALISAGVTLFQVIGNPYYLLLALPGTLNFLVVFGPGFIQGVRHHGKVSEHRARHAAAQLPAGSAFHQCSVCQKTEHDDATLEFRVLANGDELCSVCRPAKTA